MKMEENPRCLTARLTIASLFFPLGPFFFFLLLFKPITLSDIRAPIFTVGTVGDHVAPWRSTYKINFQTEADVRYLLTSGGHNAGSYPSPATMGTASR